MLGPLKSGEKDIGDGPTVADQPRQWQRSQKTRLMHLFRIKLHCNKVCTTTRNWKPVFVAIIRGFVYRILTIKYKAAWEKFIQKLNLFAPMKGALDAVLWLTSRWNAACMKSSNPSAKSFMWLAYNISCRGWKNLLDINIKETFVEEINFAKGVPMIYVNFVVTVIIIAIKNRHYCHTVPCVCVYILLHHILYSVGFLYV